ncbi:hypothetical protein [Zunongwangia pacifica]|uniref:Endosialidase-like protein n=1 Tax=Zunongwangia pacifica TaxID=2911062 RepID=A0A9X1ZY68_9FLAO|nr:hypothetical protein [Zunongwangia pacifica]MCL6220753.1 hypothetical protein [Zunongwangia pacifica]
MKIKLLLLIIFISNIIIAQTSYGTGAGQIGNASSYFGVRAGEFATGDHNTLIGYTSGRSLTSGDRNTFIGSHSGISTTTGVENVFLGVSAGADNQEGSYNTFLGRYAGKQNLSGNKNVFLGFQAGYFNKGSNNVFIGAAAGSNERGSNKFYLDNTSTSTPLLYGDFSTNQLGINTNNIPSGYAFAVKGKAIAEEVKVQLQSAWPDYVFDVNYNLISLKEVETYIQSHGHLPEVPSAAEVKASEGIALGEMNTTLLKKIEELTIYTIEQDKEIERLKKIEERLERIEKLLEKK